MMSEIRKRNSKAEGDKKDFEIPSISTLSFQYISCSTISSSSSLFLEPRALAFISSFFFFLSSHFCAFQTLKPNNPHFPHRSWERNEKEKLVAFPQKLITMRRFFSSSFLSRCLRICTPFFSDFFYPLPNQETRRGAVFGFVPEEERFPNMPLREPWVLVSVNLSGPFDFSIPGFVFSSSPPPSSLLLLARENFGTRNNLEQRNVEHEMEQEFRISERRHKKPSRGLAKKEGTTLRFWPKSFHAICSDTVFKLSQFC